MKATYNNMNLAVHRKFVPKRYTLMADNMYVHTNCEMDIFALRKSGFCDEFEIKHSVTDFKADFRKTIRIQVEPYMQQDPYRPCTRDNCRWCHGTDIRDDGRKCGYQPPPSMTRWKYMNKHEAMVAGLTCTNYFYFYVPEELMNQIEVPEHAGLCAFDESKSHVDFCLQIVKEAPRLHSNKLSDKTKLNIIEKLADRYWYGRKPDVDPVQPTQSVTVG